MAQRIFGTGAEDIAPVAPGARFTSGSANFDGSSIVPWVDFCDDPIDHRRVVGMTGPVIWMLTVLTCGVALARPAPRTSPGRIGIGEIGPPGLPVDLRIRLEEAVAAGLKAAGVEVVSVAELARARAGAGLESCVDPQCERRLAQITDTRLWLRGTCALDTSTYRLHLELVDAASGVVEAGRDDVCDICTEADVAAVANVAASALKASLGRAGQAPAAAPDGGSATSATAVTNTTAAPGGSVPGAGPPPSTRSAVDRSRRERPLWRRALPWVALGAGIAAAAGGTYYLVINNRCGHWSSGTCEYHYDTLWQGVPLLALAAALTTTAIVLLALPDRTDPASGPASSSAAFRTEIPGAQIANRLLVSSQGVAIVGVF